jgi:hypothetical protein
MSLRGDVCVLALVSVLAMVPGRERNLPLAACQYEPYQKIT